MKTLLGYQDKTKGGYKILDSKMPLLTDERYSPFLITTAQFFFADTQDIEVELSTVPIRLTISRFKNILGTILVIPGTISAIIYLLNFLTAVVQSGPFPFSLPPAITNLTFWVAIVGAMILWHEAYRTRRIANRIKPASAFAEQDTKAIKTGSLGLARFTNCAIHSILELQTKTYLAAAFDGKQVDTFKLLTILLEDPHCQLILEKLNLEKFYGELETNKINEKNLPKYPIPALRSLLIYAVEEAVLSESSTIAPEHLFTAVFKVFPSLELFLRKKQLSIDLLRHVSQWIQIKASHARSTRTFDPGVPYFRTGGIAKEWVYGWTYILNHFSEDLTVSVARKGGRHGIGHDEEMEQIISILSKVSKNNVLLTGESGTGKSSMVKGLAERINSGTIPPKLKDMRVVKLDINGLIAGAPQFGNLEALIQKTMNELQKAGNTILFIDEIQEIVPAKGQESQHSLAGILLPYILENKFPVIGTITYADYKRFFYSRESLRQSFQIVEIKEVTPEAAFEILLTRLEELQDIYNIEITFPAILAAIELAQRYIFDRKLPDSAVNTIEAACASLQNTGERRLLPSHVAHTISVQTEIPVEDITSEEASKLLDLEKRIRTRVIGQDEAVHQVVEALKRSRTGIRDPKRPIGSFLFLGPTGVGKTHISKVVSEEYFGTKREMIRLDMSEYKEISSVEKLLGSSNLTETSQAAVSFLDKVKRNPFSVILLDEIEKAHSQILDLFLQVLDEGRLTTNTGETISFNNAIIICTSNIGSKTLLETLENPNAMFEEAKQRVLLELRQQLRVEFLNRFDKIIVFQPHSMENLAKIAELLLKDLRNRMQEKKITLKWEDSVSKLIAQKSYQPGMGARPQRRYIQDNIEGMLAEKILKKEINPGDTFELKGEMIVDNATPAPIE